MSPKASPLTSKVPLLQDVDNFSNATHVLFGTEPVQNCVNILLLIFGSTLNAALLLTVLFGSSLRTSLGCYLLSLICSDLILLSDVLREVLLRCCSVNFQLNLDYVSYVTFEASALTLAMISLDRYVLLCHSNTVWSRVIPTIATAGKSILVIWSMATMTTAMQLHLHNRVKEETFGNIFVSATLMFTALPTAVILFLASLIFYEGKTCDEPRDTNHSESLLLLGGLTIGFFVTMLPRRIALVINFLYPSGCCSAENLNAYYALTKTSSVIYPVVCIATSETVREAMQDVFRRCRWQPIKLSFYDR